MDEINKQLQNIMLVKDRLAKEEEKFNSLARCTDLDDLYTLYIEKLIKKLSEGEKLDWICFNYDNQTIICLIHDNPKLVDMDILLKDGVYFNDTFKYWLRSVAYNIYKCERIEQLMDKDIRSKLDTWVGGVLIKEFKYKHNDGNIWEYDLFSDSALYDDW